MLNSLSLFQLLVGLALTLNLAQAAPTEQKVHKMSLRRVPVPRDHTAAVQKRQEVPISQAASSTFCMAPVPTSTTKSAPSATVTVLAKGSNGNGFNPDQYLPGNGAGPFVDHVSNITVGGGGLHGLAITDMGPDWKYYATFEIGTPAREFKLVLDSSTPDTWVVRTTPGSNHTTLGKDSSSTFVQTTREFNHGSNINGTLGQDTMYITGLAMPDKLLGAAIQPDATAIGPYYDGWLGLGPSEASTFGQLNPVEKLYAAGKVKAPVIGFTLGRWVDDNDGEITFGGVHPEQLDPKTSQTLTVLRNDTGQYDQWRVNLTAATSNGKVIAQGRKAQFHTTSPLVSVPECDCTALFAEIPGAEPYPLNAGFYQIPCTTEASIRLQFGQASFEMDVRDLLVQPTTGDMKGMCLSTVVSTTGDEWIIGAPFMKNVHMALDYKKKTVQVSGRAHRAGL